MELKDVQNEYNGLVRQVKDLQAEWNGKDEPREVTNQIKTAADRMDELATQMESISERKATNNRISRHLVTSIESTGHAVFAGADDTKANGRAYQVKDGFAGVTTKTGQWQPLYQTEYVEKHPHIKASFDPKYAAVFARYLRGEEKSIRGEDHDLLLQGKALAESTNTGGGFAVPVDFIPEVIRRLPGMTKFVNRARHINTNRDMVMAPRIKGPTTGYTTMYSSAVAASMVSENPAAGSALTQPIFESVSIPVNTGKMETIISRNLVADAAFDIRGYITDIFGETAALFKEQMLVAGNGIGQPLGVINDPDVTLTTSKAAATVSGDDPKELRYNTPVQYTPGSLFVLSLDCLRRLRELKDGNGNYLWSPGFDHGADSGVPSTLEGVEYDVTDFMPTAGTTGNKPMFYGNPKFYWVVDRLDMSIQVLNELYAESNQVAYLAFFRFGGHVVLPEAFRVLTLA